ncbi:hypothetical protein GKR41_00167 [Candidatus Vallotia lariciata]|nr:hypothetical protein GKR41_00167 [Candidatus Vallotia lariciata]
MCYCTENSIVYQAAKCDVISHIKASKPIFFLINEHLKTIKLYMMKMQFTASFSEFSEHWPGMQL